MKLHLSSALTLALVSALILGFGGGCSKPSKPARHADTDYYTCPMHPSVRQLDPGSCPICRMDLVEVKKATAEPPPHAVQPATPNHPADTTAPPENKTDTHATVYTCPMHPDVKSKEPGRCPICKMTLIVEPPPDEASAEPSPAAQEGNVVRIAPERLQAIGVRTGVVTKMGLTRELRAPGMVVLDESSLRDVNLRSADGYIEKLYANYTGHKVRKGEPLALILSEGWIEAQQNYIQAYRSWRRTKVMSPNENPVALQQEFSRMRARLRVWDLSEAQLAKLEATALNLKDYDLSLRRGQGQGLSGFFELQSPIDGLVVEKPAVEGAKFEKGQTLFKLANLSTLWIEAEFPEDIAPFIAVGTPCDISFPALPDIKSRGAVTFIYPQVSAETRRLKARFVMANPQMKLLPGMYANVTTSLRLGEKLAVPFDAVIPTGDRFVVFLDRGGGKLQPRFVKIGEKLGDQYEVVDGLTEGDRVITSANFLIDSESRIQGALKMWSDKPEAGSAPSR
jgi:Cu(I)/Ag(I) efflux system membrane fusion protein